LKTTSILSATTVALAGILTAGGAHAQIRDQIRVVGSSTVFPYSQAVAEEFSKQTRRKSPVVESTGTGGGFKVFCQGIGPSHADITGASRPIKKSEFADCVKNGVTDITELPIGFDGLSIAISRKNNFDWDLTERDIFLALAAEVPDEKGEKLIPNPYKTWNQINPKLPNTKIEVFGPPPTSGTRDAFVELTMHDGCDALPYFKELKKKDAKAWNAACSRLRQDGPFIEAGENDNLIVQRLQSDPGTMGIFGYSFLFENQDSLKAVKVEGVAPTFETIADNSYKIARPIFIYIKNAHRNVIPGMREFIAEFVSDNALGKDGYLAERGLTVLSDDKRKDVQEAARSSRKLAEPQS
jgi:phosphate transport system substrate-binding protein